MNIRTIFRWAYERSEVIRLRPVLISLPVNVVHKALGRIADEGQFCGRSQETSCMLITFNATLFRNFFRRLWVRFWISLCWGKAL